MKTVVELVTSVHLAAVELGIDLTPKDTAFIIAAFLQGMVDDPSNPGDNAPIQRIVDELETIKDE